MRTAATRAPGEGTTRPARCLIVDDEAPAREELRWLLGRIDGVQVVGEAATAEEALVLLESVDYDLVCCDIRMPGLSGLELAAAVRDRDAVHHPAVVFTTAYPDHAVEAFELAAADYVLKPVEPDRLARAVDRVLTERGHTGGEMTAARPRRPEERVRIPVQRGDRTVLVDRDEILFVNAARGYCYLKLAAERVLVSYSLSELERRLGGGFFRTHRSYLVNLDHVRALEPDFKGAMVLVMDDGDRSRVPVSRRQARELRDHLGM
ncbi:MAG: LytTR family DNA-binding domain-containing protein [Actinomycetota bacterium]|nr:LytTR family DNA-binding domain-containing protein [Actinomycetota bacterium]